MKRRLLVLILLSLFLTQLIAPSSAVAKAGTKCTKLNSTTVSAGVKYTCIKSGTKLVWNKGVKVATPTPTETRRPQKITLSENARTFEKFILNIQLPVQTEEMIGYSIESQSQKICTVYGEIRVSFYEVGTCILKISVKETTKYLANSELFYINVVAKPTPTPSASPTPTPSASPTPTTADSLAGIRASAIANNTFYIDRGNCHSRGINAELQINEAGNWKRLAGAMGWEVFANCPAAQPVQPWVAIDVPAGTTLRWRFWLPGSFDLNSATFTALVKKGQTPTTTATPSPTVRPTVSPTPTPTPTVRPTVSPTPTPNAAADAAAKAAADAAAKAAADAAAKTAADAAAKAAADAAAKAAADAAAKAAADAAAKAAADAAKTIRYFTATGTQVFCKDLNPASSFVSGRVVIPRDGFTSKPSTNYQNGTVARVYSGVFYRFFDGGYGVSGTFQTWTRNSWQESWKLYLSGPWTPTVEITCSYLG